MKHIFLFIILTILKSQDVDDILIPFARPGDTLTIASSSGGFVELDKDIEYYENGQIKSEGGTVADRKHGRWIYYHENGGIKEVGNYENGELIGKWTYYFENGGIKEKVNYKNGLRTGKWTQYNPDGSISSIKEIINLNNKYLTKKKMVEYYENGGKKAEVILVGLTGLASGIRTVWSLSGDVLSEQKFSFGYGMYVEYYDNGQIKMSGPCRKFTQNGFVKTGKWLMWDENGKIISIRYFDFNGNIKQMENETQPLLD
jgi:antitoxin component YwqK of YwqJK toxin-antitoxin module